MMSWHLAPALKQLLAEANKKWPNRSKSSDGTIGDAAHSARTSDHNPNGRGSVNAVDITVSGIDKGTLIAIAKKHPSVRYIISDRKIMNRDIGNWAARPYRGSNPHTKHVHISLYQSSTAENRTQSWGLANAKPVSGVGGGGSSSPTYKSISYGDMVQRYTKGDPVKDVQKAVEVKVDGFCGPDTVSAIKAFQKKHGLDVDGIVGPDTWAVVKKVNGGSAPKPSTSKAPKFPLPSGSYFGPKSGPDSSVSGYYSNREHLRTWQKQMRKRGWTIKADGLYGPTTARITKQFQKEKGLSVDGLIGAETWAAAWTEPVT